MRPEPMSLLDYREFPILYVDDEPENLRIFELSFRRKFRVFTAKSGVEGLRVMQENPVAVVLSDHRMPEMTGTQFLARVREVDAKTVRMLVTAYGDAETLGDAVNDGAISRYVPKPWNPEEMETILRRAIEVYALDREREVLLNELTQLNLLSRELYAELDLERLGALLVESAHRNLGFDGVTLLLFEERSDRLRWEAFAPLNGELEERVREIRLGGGTTPRLVERLRKGDVQMLLYHRAADLEVPLRQWLTEVSADEIVVAPLIGSGQVLGALAVDNRRGHRPMGPDDRTLLDGLANQAAIAIENARLVEDLRRSRAQVLRADRLGTLGTLAAGLAHEINNPLVSVHTFLSLAPEKRDSEDGEFWGAYHDLACKEVERIRGLVATMSGLGRGGASPGEREMVDLEHLVAEVRLLLHSEAERAGVELEVAMAEGTPKVWVVRDHLHQVLMNLLLNALHASHPGGRITVACGPEASTDGRRVWIEVSDEGEGIAPAHLERIFDPFFTTKDPDQGSGLGLMITHQVVADHGGTIDVRSRPGEGTTFTLHLPTRGPAPHLVPTRH